LALDMVPHTDYQLDDGKGLVLAADLGLGVALTYKLKNSADAPLLLTGVLGGVLPDVLAVSESWLGVRVSTPLHRFFHTRVRPPLAVSALTQITASAIFAFALRSRARQRQTL
jgi:uncharacterized membrane protein YeiH